MTNDKVFLHVCITPELSVTVEQLLLTSEHEPHVKVYALLSPQVVCLCGWWYGCWHVAVHRVRRVPGCVCATIRP